MPRALHLLLAAGLAVAALTAAGTALASPAAVDDGPTDAADNESNVTFLRAGAEHYPHLRNATAIERHRERGTLVPTEGYVHGDAVVVGLHVPALADALERQDGTNATERFRAFRQGTNGSVEVRYAGYPSCPTQVLSYQNSTYRVVASGHTRYLVFDTAETHTTIGDCGITEFDPGTIGASVEVRVQDGDDWTNVTSAGDLDRREASAGWAVEGQGIDPRPPGRSGVFLPTDIEHVSGATTLAPGANLTVAIREKGGQRLAREGTTVVYRDGESRYEAPVDLEELERGTDLVIAARYDERRVGRWEGTVVPPEAAFEATAENGTGVRLTDLRLSRGGTVTVHRGGPEGPVVASQAFLPGATEAVTVEVSRVEQPTTLAVVAHRPGVGGHRTPYRANGSIVSERVRYRPPTPTLTPNDTVTPTREPTGSAPPASRSATPTDTAGQTGFGIVAVVVAVALAGRRAST